MSLVKMSNGLASYSCEEGYDIRGKRTRECSGGVWRGRVPSCESNANVFVKYFYYLHSTSSVVECPDPESPANGFIEVLDFTGFYQFGTLATYQCNPGYILWGNSSR
jgi:hypothetical protein